MSAPMPRKSIESMRLENMSFAFPHQPAMFEGITVDFPMGRGAHISGSAGVGKSVLLKILTGLLQPTSGKYVLGGVDVVPMSFEEFLPYRLNIGYSFDMGGLLSNHSLLDNLLMPLRYHEQLDPKEGEERAEMLMREFCIWVNRQMRPANVSGGQRKACCVARAFINKPEVLILDQPTIGLDKVATAALAGLITKGYKDGWLKYLILTSNDTAFAESLGCENFVVFNKALFSYSEFEKKVLFG